MCKAEKAKILGETMKNFLKSLMFSVVALVCVFSFSACGTPVSETTADTGKVLISNNVSTNGGMTAVYGEYLYFINGTKINDGASVSGNKKSGICRVKMNAETGEIDSSTYELLVDDLVGFANGSLYFFGDFMYYAAPSGDVDSKNNKLYNETKFYRYDLVNKGKQLIYTTKVNSADETLSYTYYVVGDALNLVVYEKTNATLTSIKIGNDFVTNYVIDGVTSCVMSENNGKVVTPGASVDANSFVFYTTANKQYDVYQTGVQVYRVSPVSKEGANNVCISNEGLSISLLCIRAGKLIFSVDSQIYCQPIVGGNERLDADSFNNIISYKTFDNIAFIENDDLSISVLYYDTDTHQIAILTWKNGITLESNTICKLDSYSNFSLIGIVTITETEEVPDESAGGEDHSEATEDGTESETPTKTVTSKMCYLTYIADSAVYKLEIMHEEEGTMQLSKLTQPVKLSTLSIPDTTGLLVPEIIGDYLYVMANEINDKNNQTGNVYMYRLKLTIKENAADATTSEFVGMKEEA